MNNLNVRGAVEQSLISFTHQCHDRRTCIRLPARVAAFCRRFRARQGTQRFQHAHNVLFTAVDQGTDQADDLCAVVTHGHHAHVQGGFHHAFRHVRVANNAVWRCVQLLDERVTRLCGQRGFIRRNGLQHHRQVFLFCRQFVFQDLQIHAGEVFQLVRFRRRHCQGSEGFARDRVTQSTAVEVHQTQIQFSGMARQETRQQFVGVAQAQVNITAGVTAFQPFQRQLKGLESSRDRFAGQRQGRDEIDPARAAHVDLTFFFGVGVDQNVRLQPVCLETERAIHARFFSHGQQHFQRTVFNAVVSQHGQRGSHTNTVICAQGRAARLHPLAVDVRLNRVFCEVVNGVVVFLRYHVQVRLQYHWLTVFHTCGGRFADKNIANLVAFSVQTFFLCPAHNMFGKLFFVIGRVRNGADFGKNIPQRLWR